MKKAEVSLSEIKAVFSLDKFNLNLTLVLNNIACFSQIKGFCVKLRIKLNRYTNLLPQIPYSTKNGDYL
jgi:hypothetical protein